MHPDPILDSGYPYLHIARKHGFKYEQVLAVADYITYDRGFPEGLPDLNADALDDIVKASRRFRAIRRGEIDWQTGSPIPQPLDS